MISSQFRLLNIASYGLDDTENFPDLRSINCRFPLLWKQFLLWE